MPNKDTQVNVTLGYFENDKPYVVDLIENPVLSIVGGSGAGKTRLVQPIFASLVETYSKTELDIQILDPHNEFMWQYLNLNKPSQGHHTDISTFVGVLEEVKSELNNRLNDYNRLGVSTWSEYNEKAKISKSETQALKIVVIESTSTMLRELEASDVLQHMNFRALVSELSTKVRGTGIILVVTSPRGVDSGIPKNYVANSSIIIGMKMNAITDYIPLFGRALEVSEVLQVNKVAVGLVNANGVAQPFIIKAANFDMDEFRARVNLVRYK